MKDIYGEDYILISKYDYAKLRERIYELEKQNKEMHDWICEQTDKMHKSVGDTIKVFLGVKEK